MRASIVIAATMLVVAGWLLHRDIVRNLDMIAVYALDEDAPFPQPFMWMLRLMDNCDDFTGGPATPIEFVGNGLSFHNYDRSIQVIELLLAKGCDVNEIGVHGLSPLHAAMAGEPLEYIRFLLENGADPHVRGGDTIDGETPAEYGHRLIDYYRSTHPERAARIEHAVSLVEEYASNQ